MRQLVARRGYREMSDQPLHRPIAEPADDYRAKAPAPARGRKIVEEPLPN